MTEFTESNSFPFVCKIISQKITDQQNFTCLLRGNINDEESFHIWLKEFSSDTKTNWILRSSKTSDRSKYVFSRDYLCQHSSYNKSSKKDSASQKNKYCNASLKIRVKYNTKDTRYRDPYVKEGLCGIIKINFQHSHLLNVAAWGWLKRTDETRETFIQYFNCGMSPAEAGHYHEDFLLAEGVEILADASVNPPKHWIYYLHNLWRQNKYGGSIKNESFYMEKEIKGVVEDLLKEVEKKFPGVSNNTQLISNDSSSSPVPSKVSKNSIKVKSNVPSSTAIQDIPTGPRASKAIAKEKIYNTAKFPYHVSQVNTVPEEKPQPKESTPTSSRFPTKEIKISGRRIINFPYFLREIKSLNNHSESGRCNLNNIIFTHEKQDGLFSGYSVRCTICGYQNIFWSESPYQKSDVSSKFISGMLSLKHTLKAINKLLTKVQLPLLDEALFLRESRKFTRAKRKKLRASNLLNTVTPQPKTVLDKNVNTKHKANSMQEYISSVPCKNTEDLERVLIEDQLEIKEEKNDSEFDDDSDESEVILPHQIALKENKDKLNVEKTYETVNTTIIKQEIDSDTDAEDSITSEMVTVENVSNTDYAHNSKEISQQIKSGTLNNTMIPNSNKESMVELNNEFETEIPAKKARTLIQGSRTAINQNYMNLKRRKAGHNLNSVKDVANFSKPKLDSSSSKTAMNKGNVSFGANSRKLMTDQQTSSAVHINSGNNVCNAELINSVNSQIIPAAFTNQNIFVVPVQCLPQPNNVVIGPPLQHNSAVPTYQGLNTAPLIPVTSAVHQPQTSEPNANQPPLQQLTNYCTSRNNAPFIHPNAVNPLYTLRLQTVAQPPGNLLNTAVVPSISGVNEPLRPPTVVQQPANLSNNVPLPDAASWKGRGNWKYYKQ